MLFHRLRFDHGDQFTDQLTNRKAAGCDLLATGLDAGKVEKIIDQRKEASPIALDNLQVAVLLLGNAFREPAAQDTRQGDHGVQRCAQLVAHARKEGALQPVGLVEFPLLHFQLVVLPGQLTGLHRQFLLLRVELPVLVFEPLREILDFLEGEHAVDAGGQHAPDVVDQADRRRVVGTDARQRDHRRDRVVGKHRDSQDFAGQKVPAHRAESEARIRWDVGDPLDLARRKGRAELAFQLRGGEGGPAAGPEPDRLEMLEIRPGFIQEIHRAYLRAGVQEQRLEHLSAKRMHIVLAKHDVR